jgi:CheY-like chemotaxis protein
VDPGGVTKGEQNVADRGDQRRLIAPGEVGPSNRSREQRVADEEVQSVRRTRIGLAPGTFPNARVRPVGASGFPHRQANAAWTVSGRVVRADGEVAEPKDLAGRVERVHGRRWIDAQPEHQAVLNGILIQEQVVAVQVHGHVQGARGGADAAHMVHVAVGQQNAGHGDPPPSDELEEPLHFVPRIDQHALERPRTGEDESILEEWADGLRLDYDHLVILAILDDLLFTSKIKTTAKQMGVAIAVARSREGALSEMRAHLPSLVIFDLNNPRTDPLGTVAAMKADPALAGIPTVGYASHVQTDVIDAARRAGVGDVMARSLFTDRLPQILASGR